MDFRPIAAFLRRLPGRLWKGYVAVVRESLKEAKGDRFLIVVLSSQLLIAVPLVLLMTVALVFSFPFAWPFWAATAWNHVRPYMANGWLRILATLLVFTAAVALYNVRSEPQRGRFYYACIELTAGFLLAWSALAPLGSTGQPSIGIAAALGVMASIYVIVRGLDNLALGLGGWDRHETTVDSNESLHDAIEKGIQRVLAEKACGDEDMRVREIEVGRQACTVEGDNVSAYRVTLRIACNDRP